MPLGDYVKGRRSGLAPTELPKAQALAPEELSFRDMFEQRMRESGGQIPYSGSPDDPVESVLAPHDYLIMGAGTGIRGAGVEFGKRFLPTLAQSSLRGAGENAAAGVLEDVVEGENPLPNILTNAAIGTVANPVIEGAGGMIRSGFRRGARRAAEASPAPRVSAQAASETNFRGRPRQKFTGESSQQEAAVFQDVMEQVRSDPEYLDRLRRLGGGRAITNEETLAKAIDVGPMSVDELAGFKAGTAVNEVDVARAMMTKDYIQRGFLKALGTADEEAADAALETLKKIEPGVQNVRATGGRATQVQAMFVEDRVAKAYAGLADLRKKGVPFDQMQEAANKALREIERAEGFKRTLNRLTDWVRALETYATMAKLTSPVTHAVNTVSNALTFMTVRPVERLARAGAHAAQGDAAAARAVSSNLFGTMAGLRSGMKKYVKVLMEETPDLGKAAEVSPVRFNFPRPLRPIDPFRQLSAADAFWRAIITDSELNTSAMRSALKQGLKGDDLARRVTELVNDPPSSWLKKAEEVAKETVFQEDPDRFLKAVTKFRDVPGMRLVVPFIQTPYNIAKYQFQRSPLGLASPRNLRGLAAGGEAQAEAIGRLAAGAGLSLGAVALAARGEITGAYPQDPADRRLWEAEGRRPFSVRVGDRWINYGRFQPLGQYLAHAAALQEAIDAGDDALVEDRTMTLIGGMAQGITEQPFLQGMSSLLDAIDDPKRYGSRFASQTVTGLVPNFMRDVRYQTDPVMRESRGVIPGIANMVPGVSQNLPPKVDVLGRELGYAENRLERASKVSSPSRETPETEAFRRSGYVPPGAPKTLRIAGESFSLTPEEWTEFEKDMGAAVATATRSAISVSGFENMDKDRRAKIIEARVKKARDGVRERWKQRKSAARRQRGSR